MSYMLGLLQEAAAKQKENACLMASLAAAQADIAALQDTVKGHINEAAKLKVSGEAKIPCVVCVLGCYCHFKASTLNM